MHNSDDNAQPGRTETTATGIPSWLRSGLRLLATFLFLSVLVTLNRCSRPAWRPAGPRTPTPAGEPGHLPDLALTYASVELETGGACDYTSTQLGVRVWLKNGGGAGAGPFVVEVNGAEQTVESLTAGDSLSLWFAGYVHDGENTMAVDAKSQIEESREDNNRLSQRLPIPTLPPPCTPSSQAAPGHTLAGS